MENIRKKFIMIVIQCKFKGSQNTGLENKEISLKATFCSSLIVGI